MLRASLCDIQHKKIYISFSFCEDLTWKWAEDDALLSLAELSRSEGPKISFQ